MTPEANKRQYTILVVALLLFLISIGLFFGVKSYPESKTETTVNNEYILTEALPQQISSYTLRVLATYESRENTGPLTITEGSFGRAEGNYAFYVLGAKNDVDDEEEPTEGDYVEVGVQNYGGTYAIDVSINGVVQPIQ